MYVRYLLVKWIHNLQFSSLYFGCPVDTQQELYINNTSMYFQERIMYIYQLSLNQHSSNSYPPSYLLREDGSSNPQSEVVHSLNQSQDILGTMLVFRLLPRLQENNIEHDGWNVKLKLGITYIHTHIHTHTYIHTYIHLYLIQKFTWLYLCKQGEVYDGHLPGDFFRVKIEDCQ